MPSADQPQPARHPDTLRVIDLGRIAYRRAHDLQRRLQRAVAAGDAPDTLLLLEHDPVVTLGRRGDRAGIFSESALAAAGIDVVATERGGDVTYHGPGQLVAYPILRLRAFGLDVGAYLERLEAVLVDVLAPYGIDARLDAERHGVFTDKGKIASLGIHISRSVTMHGVALNVAPDMAHWDLIAPCGLPGVKAVAIADYVDPPAMTALKDQFADAFALRFDVRLAPEIPLDRLSAR